MNTITTKLSGRRILLIISGGIAAYKSLDLIRRLRDQGADVRCVLTRGGAEFITPLAVAALSENKAYTELFSLTDESEMGHIRLARDCDLVLVAPASANLISRAAQGMADDLAATVLLATDKPIMFAPAMNPHMWANVATQDNLKTLQSRGVHILQPASGDMACGEFGTGRLPEVAEIVATVVKFFDKDGKLKGKRALVTSGPTHEPLDPVRFLGNRSSGKQGHAIAKALAMAGADVTLITGPVALPAPDGVHTISVTTAREMQAACQAALPADIAIFAAAVADFRPDTAAEHKIKKNGDGGVTLNLVQNPDILAGIAQGTPRPTLVIGFAAETNDTIDNAKRKIERKGCDWLVLNDVGGGKVFGADDNSVTLFRKNADGTLASDTWEKAGKADIAKALVQEIITALKLT